MKLYATVTSERASKGQGGNKYLNTEFLAETEKGREVVGRVEITAYETGYKLVYSFLNEVNGYVNIPKGKQHSEAERIAELEAEGMTHSDAIAVYEAEKGKQQKGEKYAVCASFGCGRPVAEIGAEYCEFH